MFCILLLEGAGNRVRKAGGTGMTSFVKKANSAFAIQATRFGDKTPASAGMYRQGEPGTGIGG